MIRSPICTVVGHVDHGKTSLLDKIRGSAVAAGEAGAITQAIGASLIPLETVKKICGPLLETLKIKLTIPGLLFIDTPGHAAFTNLRKRGGALADIAVLVVDINEGFMPQTLESLEILKSDKTPFILAANKIDLIPGWEKQKGALAENIKKQSEGTQEILEKKLYELVGKLHELGFASERFDRVEDFTKQIALVPVSSLTGEGIGELLMLITGLAQKYLEQGLSCDARGKAKGIVLEVKEEKGLGLTLDTIIYNGSLKVNDLIVVGGIEKPVVTKVRALLEPEPLAEMREKKAKFRPVKEVFAAAGVKILAPELGGAVAGMPLQGSEPKDLETAKEEVQKEVGEVLILEGKEGVVVKADSLGSLEALVIILKEKKIPIGFASIGEITKKDLAKANSAADEFNCLVLGFNVGLSPEGKEFLKGKRIKVITHPVIYQIVESYEKYIEELKKEIEKQELGKLVRPCKIFVLKGYVFRQSNPAIVGVEIETGRIKTGDPLMDGKGKRITEVKSLESEGENITIGEQGKQLALSLEKVTVGRQIKEGEYYYTDLPEEDFKKLKELKKYLSEGELKVLKEIGEIKRKENPVWGVG